jgi:hypothetical protein
MMNQILSLLALPLLLAGAAGTAPADTDREVAIPFVSSIGSVEWQRASDDSLYIRGGNGRWYFVRTTNYCTHLATSLGIGLQTSALDQLDRNGAILVQGQRCPVASITASDGPPKKVRHGRG